MITAIMILCAIGFLLSAYAFFVEWQLTHNRAYKAACDISDRVSCTRPLLSPYAKMLGISNALLGVAFYAAIMVCDWWGYAEVVRYGTLLGALASVVFAYILYFKIHSLWLIGTSIYVVNALLVYCVYIM